MLRKSSLEGFQLPESHRKLITSLFADDTCVFLSKGDDPAELKRILDTWCLASGAKFNVRKTEIIPTGPPEFRRDLILTRRMTADTAPFDDGIRIAADGESTRLLGVFIGNGLDQQAPWEPMMDSIRRILSGWSMRSLTLTGKSVVARSIVSGKTQYLGMVQGMPKSVQKEVSGLVQDFIW
ncbi:hypothetical protein AURDEDRAFT_39357, partial [Auricularia subglabra TFB-10046 SS5]